MKENEFSNSFTVSETVLLAWICGEEAKFMEGLKMNQVAFLLQIHFLSDPSPIISNAVTKSVTAVQ